MKYFVSILFLFIAPLAYSQITLTENDVLNLVGKTFTQTSYSDTSDDAAITALIAKSGTGQTWDLSTLHNYFTASTGTYEVQAGIAGVPDDGQSAYHSATHVIKVLALTGLKGTAYNFIILSSTSYQDIGTYTNADTGSAALVYNPPKTEFTFPTQFGSHWTSSTSESIGGTTLKQSFTDDIDGEGTLIIPGGVSAPVLRLKEQQIITIDTTVMGFPISFKDTSISYRFIDKTNTISGSLSAPQDISAFGLSRHIKGTASFSGLIAPGGNAVRSGNEHSFTIDQNYPNPFSGHTAVDFSLPKEAIVSYSVYDVLGREYLSIQLGRLSQGDHTVMIDGASLPSGNYYYTIDAGGIRETKQMTIVR